MDEVQELGWEIFLAAGFRPTDPPKHGALRLAVELYGDDCIRLSERAQTEAEPVRWGDRTMISVKARLSANRTHFAVARVIARLETAKRSSSVSVEKLAAFLVAPSEAFKSRFVAAGIDLPRLAESFVVTQTCAALRIVEVGEGDGVVVTPERVYRPGSLLSWADDEAARALARGTPRSLRKVPIRDEPGRVALYRLAG